MSSAGYSFENALFEWEEGTRRLRALSEDPAARRRADRIVDAIRTCRRFRAAVDDAELDYLVTSPFLNFLDSDRPVRSPEAGWLRGAPQAEPIERSGDLTVWKLSGRLDPEGCGSVNAPLRALPDTPGV